MESFLLQASIYLGAAVLVVPLSVRLGLGSVLGYLAAGILMGPVLGLAGAEASDLRRIDADGASQFFVGQTSHAAVHQSMFESRRDGIRRRLRRAGEVLGVVLLVRVDDPAEQFVI